MSTTSRPPTGRAAVAVLGAGALLALALAGCGGKAPAVMEKMAIDRLHTVVVLPLQSPQDAGAGPVVSGMLLEQLAALRKPGLSAVEPPVLWRLGTGPLADRSAPVGDQQALRIARDMGADAVLTGMVTYAVQLVAGRKMPAEMEGPMKDMDFQRDFAARRATAAVNVQLLSVADNRAVYAHSGAAGGDGGLQVLRDAADAAIAPLERYLRQSRPSK